MSSRADYLKKYLSTGDDVEKKKRKKKAKTDEKRPVGMRLIEDDAFLSVEAAKVKDIGSDEENEEIEIIRESVKKAKINPGFKKTFAEVPEIKKEVKDEPLSPSSSPPRRQRQRHDSDNSPRRTSRKRHDSDSSPPRARKRHDSDNSPPRNSRKRHDSDSSPVRRRRDSDNSPPRNRRKDSISPPRNTRRRRDSDNSPPRRRTIAADSDSSPPRKHRRRNDSDNSPIRRSGNRSPSSTSNKREIKEEVFSDDESNTKVKKTLDGKKAGLQSAKDLKDEMEKVQRRNAKIFEELDSSVSGRHAETVYRAKQTKRGKKETDEEKEKRQREEEMTQRLKDKYKDMNKGLEQMRKRQEQLEEMARVASEPMARSIDNVAMNAHLKEVLHEADPMVNIIRKKRRETAIDRGELVYPTYQGTWVPNRFNIAPGYRWDGVDRSNGFEGKLAKSANTKIANDADYYKSIAEYE